MQTLQYFVAEAGILVLALGLLLYSAFVPNTCRKTVTWLSIGVLGALLTWTLVSMLPATLLFNDLFIVDSHAIFSKAFLIAAALACVVLAYEYERFLTRNYVEFISFILFALLGMVLLVSSQEFMTLFVSLELVTVSFYVLVAYSRQNSKSLEAGIKYLIVGALCSAFLVYGIALYFGATGSTLLSAGAYLNPAPTLLVLSAAFLLVGFGFKIACVPFHVWAPDTYEGAPTPVTAFLAVASKAAGFFVLFRVIWSSFDSVFGQLIPLILVLASITMVYGNLAAISQTNVKRLLSYSGIGHSGFLMLALIGLGTERWETVPFPLYFYLTSYLCATFTAFLVLIVISKVTHSGNISDFNGLAKRAPFLSFAMLLALMSLAGIPPLAGFFGKFLVIGDIVDLTSAGLLSNADFNINHLPTIGGTHMGTALGWITIVAAVFSTIAGLYYYCLLYTSPSPRD